MQSNYDISPLKRLLFETGDLDTFIENFDTLFRQTSLWAIHFSVEEDAAVYKKMDDAMYLFNLLIEILKEIKREAEDDD